MIHTLVYQPVFNFLIWTYSIVGNLGLAIIILAFVAKILTWPMTKNQAKNAKRAKEMQSRLDQVRKKFKHNKEKLTQEMAKIQSEYLPGQLGGCLNLIISLILLIQVRNVVVNLVNQGVHAFNQVAYNESMKYEEDKVTIALPQGFTYGTHDLALTVVAGNGNQLDKIYKLGFSENDSQTKDLEKQISDYTRDIDKDQLKETSKKERDANIGVYIEEFGDTKKGVIEYLPDSLNIYFRPPTGSNIDYSKIKIKLDDKELKSDQYTTQAGESIDLMFIGADLSRVAADFNDIKVMLPYIFIAILMGGTQYFTSKIQNSMMGVDQSKNSSDKKDKKTTDKDKNKGKDIKKNPEDMNMGEIFGESFQRSVTYMPLFTVVIALGYLGGASFFPTGVSLFWTAQNASVIIQQLVIDRQKILQSLKLFWQTKVTKQN